MNLHSCIQYIIWILSMYGDTLIIGIWNQLKHQKCATEKWLSSWLHFYQTRSAWSMDQGSTRKRSTVYNVVPRVTKFCVMWEGLSLPHDTKFGNCKSEIVDRRVIISWSLIHGSSWSGLIKGAPGILHGSAYFIICYLMQYDIVLVDTFYIKNASCSVKKS